VDWNSVNKEIGMDNTTMMMTMEFTFIGWWGWLMLAPLFRTPLTMREVRRMHGIDVDACDAAWNARQENDNES
jgi:hypothetical protein